MWVRSRARAPCDFSSVGAGVAPQNEGVVIGFYKGLVPSVAKASLSTMLLFGLFDLVHGALLAVASEAD